MIAHVTDPSVGVPIVDYFLSLLGEHGYPIVFGFTLAENLFLVGSVVPGETMQVAGGFVSSSGALEPFLLWFVAFVGSFAGGNVSYVLGRRGGRAWLARLGRRSAQIERRIRAAEVYFDTHGGPTVFVTRWVAGVKNLVPAIAGASGMPVFWFELYSFLGALVYTSLLIAAGYFFGEHFHAILDAVKGTAWGALLLVLAIALFVRYRVWRRKRRNALEEAAEEQYEEAEEDLYGPGEPGGA